MSAAPVHPDAPRAHRAPTALHGTDRRARLRACTLLLVDDEEANLDLLEAVLESDGFTRTVRTTDAREVPALMARHAPDLVLLDLHMPHRHGLDVLADLRAATPADDYRPVLVLTADATWEAKEQALARGARDFVTKPFDATEVLLRVENLLDVRLLHADERQARERAEAAEARASLLAEWSRLLAASLDPAAALAHLPRLLVPRWASACSATLGTATRDDAAHADAATVLTAPIATSDGPVGAIVLACHADHAGRAPDQALVDELAVRAGMAAESARLLAAAELATTERERLLAVVAHDLRNPLGAVAMYAEVLASLQPGEGEGAPRDDAATRSYARAALATIHSSTATMQRLVEDLLDASSLRGGALRVHRAPTPAGAPFAEADRMLRPLAEAAGVTLRVEGDAAAPDVAVDAGRVVQLLSNLVGNAVRFTPRGGTVTVRWAVADDALAGSVADAGPGIPTDELPHLFTAFWRGDRRDRSGVGLGLWIARAIVEAHGGELRVDSRPGEGTTFRFTLPLTDADRRRED